MRRTTLQKLFKWANQAPKNSVDENGEPSLGVDNEAGSLCIHCLKVGTHKESFVVPKDVVAAEFISQPKMVQDFTHLNMEALRESAKNGCPCCQLIQDVVWKTASTRGLAASTWGVGSLGPQGVRQIPGNPEIHGSDPVYEIYPLKFRLEPETSEMILGDSEPYQGLIYKANSGRGTGKHWTAEFEFFGKRGKLEETN